MAVKNKVCLICGEETFSLKSHLRKKHQQTLEEYFIKYYLNDERPICKLPECQNKTKFHGMNYGFSDFCCMEHLANCTETKQKRKNTCMEKYGTESHMQNKNTIEKIKKTKKEKYGNENFNNREKFVKNYDDEKKNRWRKNLQETWKNKTEEEIKDIAERTIETKKEKYGDDFCTFKKWNKEHNVENISQTEEWKIKFKKTWEEKSDEERKVIYEKKKKTCLDRYGVENFMCKKSYRDEIVKKSQKTRLEKGQILPPEMVPDYEKYKRKVYALSKKAAKEKFSEQELKTIGKCGIEGAMQVDHKFSIKEGFLNNILPSVIAHPVNLEIIGWRENDCKKHRSSISLSILLEDYLAHTTKNKK